MPKNRPVDPNLPVTKMFEADADTAAWVAATVSHIKSVAAGNATYAFALATSITAQTFMTHGGKYESAENIGECFKAGLISTINAYRDAAKVNHKGTVRLN